MGFAAGLLGAGVSAIGSIMGGQNAAAAAEAQKQQDYAIGLARYQAFQQAGHEAIAAGQRNAQDRSLSTTLLLSKSRSLAAASGAGATDTSVGLLQAGIQHVGEFQKSMEMYKGEDQANQDFYNSELALAGAQAQANADQYKADVSRANGLMGGFGTLLSGGAGLLSKINLGG